MRSDALIGSTASLQRGGTALSTWVGSPGILVSIACLTGAALRLLLLGSKSMWLDEVFSITVARWELNKLWTDPSFAYHPPLFYLLIKPWIEYVDTPFMLRLPMAILDVLSLPLVYVIAQSLFDRRTALTSLWLAALSPLLIWYAQEFRSYSLLVLLALLTTAALISLFERPRILSWLLFVGALVAAFYLHYDAVLLLPLQIVLFLGLAAAGRVRTSGAIAWLSGLGATAVAYIPWLRSPAPRSFFRIFTSDSFYMAPLVARTLGIPYTTAFPFLLIAAVGFMMIGTLGLWIGLRRYGPGLETLRRKPVIRLFILVGFVIMLVLSVLPWGYTVRRHLLTAVPFVLVGFAWVWPWESGNRPALAILLGLSLVASLVNIIAIPKSQWNRVAPFVVEAKQSGDVVIPSPSYMDQAFDFYARGQVPQVTIRTSDPSRAMARVAQDYSRVWLVCHTSDIGANLSEIQVWLNQHAELVSSESFY